MHHLFFHETYWIPIRRSLCNFFSPWILAECTLQYLLTFRYHSTECSTLWVFILCSEKIWGMTIVPNINWFKSTGYFVRFAFLINVLLGHFRYTHFTKCTPKELTFSRLLLFLRVFILLHHERNFSKRIHVTLFVFFLTHISTQFMTIPR